MLAVLDTFVKKTLQSLVLCNVEIKISDHFCCLRHPENIFGSPAKLHNISHFVNTWLFGSKCPL